jgi:gluconokinase
MKAPHRHEAVIGLDLGTSGCRAAAFDIGLACLDAEKHPYGIRLAAGGAVEQDPLEVAAAAEACLRRLAARLKGGTAIRAIALCGTASSLAFFEPESGPRGTAARFRPAAPAWLWADGRARQEAQALRCIFGADAFRRLGCPFHASYWPAKLLHLGFGSRPARKGLRHRAGGRMIAGIKDYLLFRLTGRWVVDCGLAAATGLYDSRAGQWDGPLSDHLGIEPAMLPDVAPPTARLALTSPAARRLGLDPQTTVAAGTLDGIAAHLGLGCAAPGMASVMIGTSGAVRMGSSRRRIDPRGRTWTYPVEPGLWLTGAAVNNGGNVLDWAARLLRGAAGAGDGAGPQEEGPALAAAMMRLAFSKPPGAAGPLFIPYLFGERSPLWREDLSAALVGLRPDHDAADICRAVVEGLGLGIASAYRALVHGRRAPAQVRVSGGIASAPQWQQLLADLLGLPVGLTSQAEPTAAGAAMIGWRAVTGKTLAELASGIGIIRKMRPREAPQQRLDSALSRMEKLREFLNPCAAEAAAASGSVRNPGRRARRGAQARTAD